MRGNWKAYYFFIRVPTRLRTEQPELKTHPSVALAFHAFERK